MTDRGIVRPLRAFLAIALTASALAACAGAGSNVTPSRGSHAASTTQAALGSKIQHVIVVILENRSFDNLFAADTALAKTANGPVDVDSGLTAMSKTGPVTLSQVSLSASSFDESHSHGGFLAQYDGGKNDGWANTGYAYIPAVEVQPYYDIAAQSAISDRFFHGVTGPTFPSHLMIGAGTTFGIIENPSDTAWGCDAKPGTTTGLYDPATPGEVDATAGPFPCFDDLSIFDLMDRSMPQTSWRFYVAPEGNDITGELNIASYFRHIRYGPDWNDDIATTDAQILTDLSTNSLRQVSFVIPNDASTDHAGYPSMGPTYIANLVNAFGQSAYYNNSLMIVTWDDWGGWYDHVAPGKRADGSQLSFRKPILFIGGYAKHNYVTHVPTEDASIPKTIEEIFNLPLGGLGQYDVAAAPFDDAVDVTQTPPAFKPITSTQGLCTCAATNSAASRGRAPVDMGEELSSGVRPKTYFRVIPGDFMRRRADGRFDTMADDFYAKRSADY